MQHKVLIHDADQQEWLSFSQPKQIYSIQRLEDILPTLSQIENHVRQDKLWAAGWISYEASSAFDESLATHGDTPFPLLWMGVFQRCESVDVKRLVTQDHVDLLRETVWDLNVNFAEYSRNIDRIKSEIEKGNTYQVNYTIRQSAKFELPAEDLFLGFASNARYGAFIDAGRFSLCSASPELFFKTKGDEIVLRPMKGTAPRGRFVAEDEQLRSELSISEKNRAENLMIVDMIRNDIGRAAEIGSVSVPKLFDIEKYPTVWQMTSTVEAKIPNQSLTGIFQALFPCASITGAPKINTMRIINRLEASPRNIYTGSIGFIRPDMSMQFNVAIRTILLDKERKQAEYGVGGGIVWDSSAESEFDECLTKSKVLSGKGIVSYQLLETLLWTPDKGIFLLNHHLSRVQSSAEYFGFTIEIPRIKAALLHTVQGKRCAQRLRLCVAEDGGYKIQTTDFDDSRPVSNYRVKLASESIDSNDIYLYHKTTNRSIYNSFAKRYPAYDDVLLINEKNEVTESSIANLVVSIDGKRYTPPITSGLLNGTYRQFLIDQGEISEKIVTKKDLQQAQACFLINSLRKMWPIEVEI